MNRPASSRKVSKPEGRIDALEGPGGSSCRRDRERRLHWQSKLVLLLVLPAAGVWALVLLLHWSPLSTLTEGMGELPGWHSGWHSGAASAASLVLSLLVAPVLSVALVLLVWYARAASAAGALTGGLLMACFCLTTPGWHSSAWPLIATLVLTLAVTRAGRASQQEPTGSANESQHGRSAAQVAANLGLAALAGTLINGHGRLIGLTVMLAGLAEAAADTVASELGHALAATPRLITTLELVPPGTDGGITAAGTALGCTAAGVVSVVGVLAMALPWSAAWMAWGAAAAGLLFDSLLGATLERAGWLNNDAVNFLSTAFAAVVALAAGELSR